MFDAHPISVFVVVGFHGWYFARRPTARWAAIAGMVVGAAVYLGGNWFAHGTLGVLNGLVGAPVTRGDHYVPLIDSDMMDMVRIARLRYSLVLKVFLVSGAWLPLLLHLRRRNWRVSEANQAWLFTGLGFLVTSALFSEAVGNGFQLYLTVLFIPTLLLLLARSWVSGARSVSVMASISLVLALMYVNFAMGTAGKLMRYAEYAEYFSREYPQIAACVPNPTRALMRPTFAFALAHHQAHFEYTYNLLFFMKQNRLSFSGALLEKGYEVVALDTQDARDMDPRGLVDFGAGRNWFYNTVAGVGVSPEEVRRLVQHGALSQICRFDELSHGMTTFYRIDRARLESLLPNLSVPAPGGR